MVECRQFVEPPAEGQRGVQPLPAATGISDFELILVPTDAQALPRQRVDTIGRDLHNVGVTQAVD